MGRTRRARGARGAGRSRAGPGPPGGRNRANPTGVPSAAVPPVGPAGEARTHTERPPVVVPVLRALRARNARRGNSGSGVTRPNNDRPPSTRTPDRHAAGGTGTRAHPWRSVCWPHQVPDKFPLSHFPTPRRRSTSKDVRAQTPHRARRHSAGAAARRATGCRTAPRSRPTPSAPRPVQGVLWLVPCSTSVVLRAQTAPSPRSGTHIPTHSLTPPLTSRFPVTPPHGGSTDEAQLRNVSPQTVHRRRRACRGRPADRGRAGRRPDVHRPPRRRGHHAPRPVRQHQGRDGGQRRLDHQHQPARPARRELQPVRRDRLDRRPVLMGRRPAEDRRLQPEDTAVRATPSPTARPRPPTCRTSTPSCCPSRTCCSARRRRPRS